MTATKLKYGLANNFLYAFCTVICFIIVSCSASSDKKDSNTPEGKYYYRMLDSSDGLIHSGNIQISKINSNASLSSVILVDTVFAENFYINKKISACKTETSYDKRTGFIGIKFCPDATDDNVYFTIDAYGKPSSGSWSHITYSGLRSKGKLTINKIKQ